MPKSTIQIQDLQEKTSKEKSNYQTKFKKWRKFEKLLNQKNHEINSTIIQ